jgi:hypothetical protein
MKTLKKPAASKLLIRFDNELKDILLNDLMAFAKNNPFLMRNKQAMMPSALSVA